MQPSPEIREATMQVFREMNAHNAAGLRAMLSQEPGVIFLGSQPTEWYESVAAVEPMLQQVARDSGDNLPPDLSIQAMQEGTVGWAVFRFAIKLPDGKAVTMRGTNVYHQEGGAWKQVHFHVSAAIPDELIPSIAQ